MECSLKSMFNMNIGKTLVSVCNHFNCVVFVYTNMIKGT